MPDLPPTPTLDGRVLRQIMRDLLAEAGAQFDRADSTIPRWNHAQDYSDEQMQALFTGPFDDAGLMFALLFARLMEITQERLNRVPEKNQFAFLDTMEVSLLPPSPATVPLTFAVTDGQGRPALAPLGTQCVTQPGSGQPIPFETDQALTVLPARIVQSVTIDPNWDRFSEQTMLLSQSSDSSPAGFTPFAGGEQMPHILYLGGDDLLDFRHPQAVELLSGGEGAEFLKSLSWQVRYAAEPAAQDPTVIRAWEPVTNDGWTQLTLENLKTKLDTSVGQATLIGLGLKQGVTKRWLRAILPRPLPDAKLELLSQLMLKVEARDLLPDAAFANSASLDISRTFLPFGELPKTGDAFYIGSEEAFRISGAKVTLKISLHPETAKNTHTLSWAYLAAGGWKPLKVTLGEAVSDEESKRVTDTDSLQSVSFVMPTESPTESPAAWKEVNGKSGYWIRVCITQGDYGKPPVYKLKTPHKPEEGYVIDTGTGTLDPPQVISITLSYTAERCPQIVTQNGFLLIEQTEATQSDVGFTPFISVRELVPTYYADTDPAFYLGFDAAFPQEMVTLYASVSSRVAGSVVRGGRAVQASVPGMPSVVWEYFNGAIWRPLTIQDSTNNLTESGTLEFLMPTDIRPLARFDLTERYWIRARVARNDPFYTQHLSGLWLNTVPATQAVWVDEEILGASNGLPGQSLGFSRSPVLSGQEVLVREKERPSAEEASQLAQEEGPDAIVERFNAATGQREIWVCWHETPNFVRSGPHSRHYTLDHATGILRFGDGKRGLIPPRDTNSIVATYQTGGGAEGNVPARTIVQISNALPGVASVTNPLPSEGGAAQETMAQVRQRGPQTLKHRHHAVSASDMEWLVHELGTQVARVKSLPNINRDLRFEPGWVTLIVVPQGREARLTPGALQTRRIGEFLAARAATGLGGQLPSRINVIGPGYIDVMVEAEVAPRDIHEATAVRNSVQRALEAFFHPLSGGRDGQGWEFGRNVYASEVAQLLQRVIGVNHIKTLTLQPAAAQSRFTMNPPVVIPADWPVNSPVRTGDLKKAGLLADPVTGGVAMRQLLLKGFKEGDRVTVAQDFRVISPETPDRTIEVTTIGPAVLPGSGFPGGSPVTSFDGAGRTRLKTGLTSLSDTALKLEMEEAVFKAGDIITLFYPFPMTVRAVRKPVVTLTVLSMDINSEQVTVAPFGTDAVGLPAGSRVQKVEPLFESARRSWLEEAIQPNQMRVTEIKLRQERTRPDVTKKLIPALKPGDLLHVHVPLLTLNIDSYKAEGFEKGCLLTSLDNRIRLPLAAEIRAYRSITTLQLSDFADGEDIYLGDGLLAPIASGNDPMGAIPVKKVLPITDVVYLDDNFLVCSGDHKITLAVD